MTNLSLSLRPAGLFCALLGGLGLLIGPAVLPADAQSPPPAPPAPMSVAVPPLAEIVRPLLPPWPQAPAARPTPSDIRIMQEVLRTAIAEVPLPEPPEGLAAPPGWRPELSIEGFGVTGVLNVRYAAPGARDISGFYLPGYGYLFTIRLRAAGGYFGTVAGDLYRALVDVERMALVLQGAAADSVRRARQEFELQRRQQATESEAERQARRQALEAWNAEYQRRLIEGLREALALYGGTLQRARPQESITLVLEPASEPPPTVILSVRAGALTGTHNLEANRRAIRVTEGVAGLSESLARQLRIMARIVDTAFASPEPEGDRARGEALSRVYTGGQTSWQYLPGYGAIFRKSARLSPGWAGALNLTIQEPIRVALSQPPVPPLTGAAADSVRRARQAAELERRQRATELEAQRQAERAQRQAQSLEEHTRHLAELKARTASLLAVYGPTLTELKDEEWVAFHYDVGPAAALLEGGIDHFLVQVRMEQVREAARRGGADPAAWLLSRLVTNQRDD